MVKLIQTLISGLSLGSIYALIALGYTMVYGIAKMLNFAHGDVIMVGGYVAFYATGFAAAAAIAQRILTEGAPAVEDYKRFLSSGGSSDPISLLKIAGVDMASPEPVAAALRLFNELIGELEELI